MRKKTTLLALTGCGLAAVAFYLITTQAPLRPNSAAQKRRRYEPRVEWDSSGFSTAVRQMKPWHDPTSLESIRDAFVDLGPREIAEIDRYLSGRSIHADGRLQALLAKASLQMYDGKPAQAYDTLMVARKLACSVPRLETDWLYRIVFLQGVAGLRRGENENCLACRGDSACIFPIAPTAVHQKPDGSRLAIRHFTEYLREFPDDAGVRWLLNLAYMTLGKYPHKVPGQYLMDFAGFGSELDIGRFRDIAPVVGVDRFNESGGAVMDDFDNDGLLDLVTTSHDPAQSMAFYRNKGDGTFEDRTKAAGLSQQFGGLNLVQTDYNNDGFLDLFIVRGAWMPGPMRPSLLRNNGDDTFTDVTQAAGLIAPLNSISATWADFDNDGFLDLFICCERGFNRLYRNRGDGTFEDVAARAGVLGKRCLCKGATWIDYDNDGYPDLFVTYLDSTPQLYHNNRNGTFTDVTERMGIHGPFGGFSCWAFDYDNDGWLDIFATGYQGTLSDVILDMSGRPARKAMGVTRLYRNLGGKKFQDVSRATGVGKAFATMGSNFADFTNDGYLDIYLGTGALPLDTVVPNRMFKNVAGQRFADVTASSRTGHLQKGHGVACGDWDRDGNVDLFIEVGGAVPGDRYHNVLFQNPGGHGNHWLEVKLIGRKTNRAAIGARIKVVTAGDKPLTVYRHISRGSSFGGNPLQQHIGLGKASSVATLEVFWPTSGTTQVFHHVAVDQAIQITEFANDYGKRKWTRIPLPKD